MLQSLHESERVEMVRSILGEVAWVGRTVSTVFGLALVLALVLGAASVALGANGDFFKVGKSNFASAVSTLNKSGAGPALSLKVGNGKPLAVDSSAKVTHLNADKVDGQSAAQLKPLTASVASIGFVSGGRGVISASRLSTGVYKVQFNRSVSDCVRVASIGRELNFSGNPDFAASLVSGGSAGTFNGGGGVTVVTRNSAGSLADLGFHLAVFC
jgi:hypothetical protein